MHWWPMCAVFAEIAEAALRVLLRASSALQPADLSATLTHCARLDMKDDIRSFARGFTAQAQTAANPAVPALAAMLADNQELAHACFEASGASVTISPKPCLTPNPPDTKTFQRVFVSWVKTTACPKHTCAKVLC